MRRFGKVDVGCVITLIIAGLLAYFLVQYVPMKIHGGQFGDYMRDQSTYISSTSMSKIRDDVMNKARKLNIPLNENNLIMRKDGDNFVYEATWDQELNLFGYVIKIHFNPKGVTPIINM